MAAAIVVVAVGALAWWPSPDNGVEPADTMTTEHVEAPGGGLLDEVYLPGDLPDGWRVVDLVRAPSSGTVFMGNSVEFDRRDGSDHAVVTMSPASPDQGAPATIAAEVVGTDALGRDAEDGGGSEADVTPTLPEAADRAVWDTRSGPVLSWRDGNQDITLTTRSRDETAARSLATDLVATGTGAGRSFDLRTGSDWMEVREHLLDGRPLSDPATNAVQLAGPSGQLVLVTMAHPVGPSELDVATEVTGRPGIYELPADSAVGATYLRSGAGDLVLAARGFGTSLPPITALQEILTSMRQATVTEWDAVTHDLQRQLAAAPVLATFDLLDHHVAVHVDGALRGICVSRTGARGCRWMAGVTAAGDIPAALPADGIPLDDGTWVGVVGIAQDAVMCSRQDLAAADVAVAPHGDQQVVLVIPAALNQSLACALRSSEDPDADVGSGSFIVNPPVLGR